MPFFGTVPTPCIEQIMHTVPFGDWPAAYVCCSGTFRIEQALTASFPDVAIHSNDVSLYSAVIANVLLGRAIAIKFTGRLAFLEVLTGDADFIYKAAGVMVAHEMSRFVKSNPYNDSHFASYVDNVEFFVDKGVQKLTALCERVKLADYFSGDWIEHVDRAIEKGYGVASFPPFFFGDYEKQYQFLDSAIEWEAPSYELYQPSSLGSIIDKVDDAGIPYCILSDQLFSHRKPVLEYVQGRKVPHYCYASTSRSSLRHLFNIPEAFQYTPLDITKIGPTSRVVVTHANYRHLNFLKDVYLAKSIIHSPGFMGFMVWVDEMLVGGIIYDASKFGATGLGASDVIYLLSDVCVTNAGHVSKLVAQIATSQTLVNEFNIRKLVRAKYLIPTARSKNRSSMKYRDIYERLSCRPADPPDDPGTNIIQYGSEVSPLTPQKMYKKWFKKHVYKKRSSA